MSSLWGIAAKRIVTCDPARATADESARRRDGRRRPLRRPFDQLGRSAREEAIGKAEIVGATAIASSRPGLVDAHTHAAWVGSRHDEYVLKIATAPTIATSRPRGAGSSPVSARSPPRPKTRSSRPSRGALFRMATLGVTTCEVKSGYGLEPEGERKQLRAIARAKTEKGLPHVVATFLALHALPESAKANRDIYVLRAATGLVPEIATGGPCRLRRLLCRPERLHDRRGAARVRGGQARGPRRAHARGSVRRCRRRRALRRGRAQNRPITSKISAMAGSQRSCACERRRDASSDSRASRSARRRRP